MEEMQQLDAQSELQNDQTQEEVGQNEPTNKELLKDMMGLDEPITDEVQTGDNNNIIDDESDEMTSDDADSKSYYTASELFLLVKNNQEIDDSRMTDELRDLQNSMLDYKKSLQGDYTKKTQKLAEEKKTLDEELQAFREKQEQAKLEQEANNNGLSTTELIEINQIVKNYFTEKGVEYDPSNEEHKILYDDLKKNAINQVVTIRNNNKTKEQFESTIKERYGDKLQQVQAKAKEILDGMPYKKAKEIVTAINNYNTNIGYALLDEAYKQLNQDNKTPANTEKPTQQKKPVMIPPHSVGKSNVPPKAKKTDPYDLSGIF